MKKNLLLSVLVLFLLHPVFCQTLYTSTVETGSRFNAGAGSLGTPVIVFDDVNIPSSQVQGTDSISIKKVNFGIRRIASAPATTVNFYYTLRDDTATSYDDLIRIPPVYIGSVDLPANGATGVTTIISFGDSINTLFALKTDTGNLYTNFQTFFLGVSFSNPDNSNGWRLTTPGAPAGLNDDAIWVYNVDGLPQRFATFFNGDPIATFYLEAFGGGFNALPVTLSAFNAHRSGKVNLLNWSTSQELNTSHFVVQRSTDGTNFNPLEQVTAAGNSSSVRNYAFTDLTPTRGTNYYRLQMVDKDNASKYSLVRSVRNTGLSDISIFPNPVKNDLSVSISSDNAGQGQMTISDITGKIILSKSINVVKGNNTIWVNTSGIAGGAYVIKVNIGSDPVTLTFTKE